MAINVREETFKEVIDKYADMVRRICFIYLRNYADVEDVFQDVFLKYFLNEKPFENSEHEKAWICRITINRCKDLCKSIFYKNVCSLDGVELPTEDKVESEILRAVLSLPTKYKDVIYLYYYQKYTATEISVFLNQKENTVFTKLHRAREMLRRKLGGKNYEF